MKHSTSRALYAYWDSQRGTRAAPERSEINPGAIRHILGDTFVLAADFVEEHRFRLAGTKVCTLFGRELKDESFLQLWDSEARAEVKDLLSIVSDEQLGVVAGATGYSQDGQSVDLELVLLPLSRRGHARVRALGVLVPLELPYWLGSQPIVTAALGALRHIGPQIETVDAPPLVAAEPGSRVQHGFVVLEGGRSGSNSR